MTNSILDTFDLASCEDTKTIITPYRDVLAEGQYDSNIVSLEDVFTDGKATALDCIQSLTDVEGTEYLVRFRVFIDDLPKWAMTFKKYGLTGSLRSLIGLQETVTIRHGTRYAFIEDRHLVQLPRAACKVESPTEQMSESVPMRKKPGWLVKEKKSMQGSELTPKS